MIALDTNVLVRFLVEDDAKQSRRAAALIERCAAEGEAMFLSDIVLVETCWVLERAYGFSRSEISGVLRALSTARQMAFCSSDRFSRALRAYEKGRAGFADYMVFEQAKESGCARVATFDKVLLKEPGFVSP